MNEEERERTMNFILEQQAQSAARMEKFETGMEKLERALIFMARTFRRERKDLRERIAALVDAQIRSEDRLANSEDRITNSEERLSRVEQMLEHSIASSRQSSQDAERRMLRIEEAMERNVASSEARLARVEETIGRNTAASETRLARIEELTGRNSEDIRSLTKFVSRGGGEQDGGEGEG